MLTCLHGTGQLAHEARRGCSQTGVLAFMDCPATIWIVRLLPMDASCWKKITDQYPPRPAQGQGMDLGLLSTRASSMLCI